MEAHAALMKEHASHLYLKEQVQQKKTISDGLQLQIEALHTERTELKSNKTNLEGSCSRCQPRWIFLQSSCYFFSNSVYETRKNWLDSRAHCISQGGELVVINNLAEQHLMSDNFRRVSSGSVWWQNGFWIGLREVVAEEKWVWVNNVTETETVYWRTGQPSRSGLQSGNCAALNYYSDTKRTWYNANCNELELNWICEMEPNET
uniref:C-type lectin domain family 4 member G-like n=1 Tax=Seriola dumerili TaxID=41447 RepID=A0A3B4TED1_SERDU